MKTSSMFISGVHGTLPCRYDNATGMIEFEVLDNHKCVNVLGKTDCVRLGLVARVNLVEGSL